MRELPLNVRNVEQLILLAPGTVAYPNGNQTALVGRGLPFAISGSRPEGYANLIDGENCLNWWQRGCGAAVTGTSLGIEAIAEFQTLTATYSAEYGGNGAPDLVWAEGPVLTLQAASGAGTSGAALRVCGGQDV